jgi:hypothetical protein
LTTGIVANDGKGVMDNPHRRELLVVAWREAVEPLVQPRLDVRPRLGDLLGRDPGRREQLGEVRAGVPPAISKPLIARYEKQYSRTYISYAGGTTDAPGTYLRIDGPQAWIEFAVQKSDKGSSHYHSVYRDKRHDYGRSISAPSGCGRLTAVPPRAPCPSGSGASRP